MSRVLRPPRGDDRGSTLVELLVVMIVLGVLAAIAIPAMVLQQRKAYETSAKADVKVITSEILALYVDDISSTFAVSGSAGTWEIRQGGTVVSTGRLSKHNVVSPNSYAAPNGNFCLSVRNTEANAQFWTADDVGLRPGDC